MRALWSLVLVGLMLCVSSQARPEMLPGAELRPEQKLTLDQVLQSVDANHPKLKGARLARDIASAKVLEKRGAFDPAVAVAGGYQLYNSSSDPGKAKSYTSLSGTYFRTDPSGIKWEAGWINNQGTVKSPASATGDVGEVFVGASIPLLRGLNINEKSVALEQAQVYEEQVQFEVRQLRLLTLLEAGSAYYNWVTAVIQQEIVRENLDLAVERATQVATSIAAGDLPRIDQVEADREVEKRREAYVKSQRLTQKAAFKLALYMWNSDGQSQEVPRNEEAPLELPKGDTPSAEEIAEFQIKALESRPELRKIELEKTVIELDRKLAENQKLPQLDLKLRPGADLGGNGIGATFKAGIELVIPLANRTADGRERAASIKLDKLGLDQVEIIRRIAIQVMDAANEIQTTEERLEQAVEVYRLSKELEEAERVKFRLGDSSLFLVNSRERSTVEAALKVLEIRNESAQAQLLLEAVIGSL